MRLGHFEKNFEFKNGLAYTEDDILIYNIFADNLHRRTTEEELLTHFSSFGEVKSVQLVADERKTWRSALRVGFIHFADATSAAKVLKHSTPHLLKSQRISVSACNSWQQPFISPPDDSDSNSDEESIQQSTSFKLTMLNDDCLEHILKKLALKDQLRFAMTCQRLRNIFEMFYKMVYRNHRLEDLMPLTLWEIREFFLIFGPHIEALLGNFAPNADRERIIEFIGKFCPNVKSINFSSTNFESRSFFKVLGKLQYCTVLKLRNCYLRDHAIHALKKLPNLRSLSLAENYELTGQYMDRLTTVTDLALCRSGIQSNHFAKVLKSLTDLKSLDIRHCHGLVMFPLSIMLKYSKKLESLKISCSIEPYECVARLPSLKRLELLSFRRPIERCQELFQELVEHKANQLESLIIVTRNCVSIKEARQIALLTNLKQLSCEYNAHLTDECLQKFANLKNLEEIVLKNCKSITNKGLLQLVQSCTNLKEVNIELCTHITDPFVSKVIQVLKSTQNQRGKEPCVFYVARAGISSHMINNHEYIAARRLLKLYFEAHATPGVQDEFLNLYFYESTHYARGGHPSDYSDNDSDNDYSD